MDAGADAIVVDIAHGHSENAISTVKNIKKAFPDCELIAGNVATAQGTEDLIKAGVDAVKVGVGSGFNLYYTSNYRFWCASINGCNGLC